MNVRLWKDDVQFIRDVARESGEPYVSVLRRYVSEAVARVRASGSGRIA